MANRPRIGVTGTARFWSPGWWCAALALRLAGGIPERISVRHPPTGKPLDGLLVGGGNDISPEHYQGDIEKPVKSDPARDELEIRWIKTALDNDIPLMGICRGAQLINVVLGGTLYQDIRNIRQHTYNRPGLLPTKQVKIAAESKLAGIFKTQHLRVNSLHHQAIKSTGKGLKVVGYDLDKITQAVESEQHKIIAVQWHPEYLIYLPSQFALFRWLVNNSN
jgi:putative glutamine amidotransferase